jgi:hypothetical protein
MRTQKLVVDGILNAPTSFKEAKLTTLLNNCNGCGSSGWWDVIPDFILGVYVGHACFIHDWMYGEGLTREDKELADNLFKTNLRILLDMKKSNKFLNELRYQIAKGYYLGVKKFGDHAFLKATIK